MKPGNRTIRKHFGAVQFQGTGAVIDVTTPTDAGSQDYTLVTATDNEVVVYEQQKLDLAGVAAHGLDIANLGTAVARSMPPLTALASSSLGYMLMDAHYISMRPFVDLIGLAQWRRLMVSGTSDDSEHETESMLFANVSTFMRSGADNKPALTQTGTNNWAQADLFSADRLYYMRMLYFVVSGTALPVNEALIVPPSFCSTSIQLVKQEDNPHLMTMAQSYELHQG